MHLDLGTVNVNGADMPVRRVLLEGLPVDIGLVVGGLALGVAFGVGGALLCGTREGERRDHVLGLGSSVAISLPVCLLAYVALFAFGRIQGAHPLPFIADSDDYAQPWEHPLVYVRAIGTASALIAVPSPPPAFA